jgi:hypothetical protein
MPKPIHEMSSWGASAHPGQVVEESEAWEATRALTGMATQLMRDKDDDKALELRNVGRQVGPSQWELFVACEPADALQQQFDTLRPEFIALHDIGTQSSRRLLAGLAASCGRPVHQLQIRRQGLGMVLACVDFVELPIAAGLPPLRMYSTETDADTQQRRRIARTLMAYSRLAAVIVGDLPPHALATALLPLHEAIKQGPWPNRQLLMLPLVGAAALAGQASHLTVGTEVQLRTTPQVTRPVEAWGYVRGAWSRLRTQLSDEAIHLPEIPDPAAGMAPAEAAAAKPAPATSSGTSLLEPSTASTPPAAATAPPRAPLQMQPMPAVRSAAPTASIDPALVTYARKCGELKGMISCCVFELATQRTIGYSGTRPGPAALASTGATLMASIAEAAHGLSLGDAAPDAAISIGQHHQLLHAVPSRPGIALHAVLDRAVTNLTLVRLQLQRLDLLLEDGDTA